MNAHRLSLTLVWILALSFVSSSLAVELYVGGNAGLTFPTGDFADTDIEEQQGGADNGTAVSAEIGVHGENGDFYVGIREDNFPARSSYGSLALDGHWKASRLIYGARLHLPKTTPADVDPVFGIALTYGATEATVDADYGGTHYSADQTTHHVPGLMLEGGVTFSLSKAIRGIVTLQYHDFVAELEEYEFSYFGNFFEIDDANVDVTYVVLNLGLRFRVLGN